MGSFHNPYNAKRRFNFDPLNLGFFNVTRRVVIENQTMAISVIDGTYICIQMRNESCALFGILLFLFQNSQNNTFPRKSFNLHKKRSLLNPMTIVSTTGYIIAYIGPFFSDFPKDDASIIKTVLLNNMDNVINWVQEVDHLFPYLW